MTASTLQIIIIIIIPTLATSEVNAITLLLYNMYTVLFQITTVHYLRM